jgi:hypothetical protein
MNDVAVFAGGRSSGLSRVAVVPLVVSCLVLLLAGIPFSATAQQISVTRDLPDQALPNEIVTVTLTQSGFFSVGSGGIGIVWEVLPGGFQYVSGSYTGGGEATWNPLNRTLEVEFVEDVAVSYQVRASSYDQPAVFSGTWRTLNAQLNRTEGAVGGNLTVKVEGNPPGSITNLQVRRGTTWLNWSWTNPADLDFSHVEVYLDGIWQANVTVSWYKATGLEPDTEHELGTRTVDLAGNVNDTWVNGTARTWSLVPSLIFDTGPGGYPSIPGTFTGTLTPSRPLSIARLYTYSCAGTGGHTGYVRIWNSTVEVTGTWQGYRGGDWRVVALEHSVTLAADETYNLTVRTGSYPQVHHAGTVTLPEGEITCTQFTDVNGKAHLWIPAIRLES